MPPVGFEPTISAGEGPQTYVLDRAATGTGRIQPITNKFMDKSPPREANGRTAAHIPYILWKE